MGVSFRTQNVVHSSTTAYLRSDMGQMMERTTTKSRIAGEQHGGWAVIFYWSVVKTLARMGCVGFSADLHHIQHSNCTTWRGSTLIHVFISSYSHPMPHIYICKQTRIYF